MAELTRIVLIADKRISFWRRVMTGVIRYVRPHHPWLIHTTRPEDTRYGWLQNWRPAGVIGDLSEPTTAKLVGQMRVRAVHIGEADCDPPQPRLWIDHAAVGAMAARYLAEKGLRNFAYFSYMLDRAFSREQRTGFERVLRARGMRICEPFSMEPAPPSVNWANWAVGDQTIAAWLRALPKPVGILMFDDDCGLWVSQICREADLRIPDRIALMGVNDDPIDCQTSHPPLSSVALPLEQLGYAAARMLDRQLSRGFRSRRAVRLLAPLRVVTRQSSDILAVDDPELSNAVRFIHEHAHEPMRVADVLEEVPVSRSVLERKFRDRLGRSPLEEIRRAHLDRARNLLATTSLSLHAIAERSGFGRTEQLCAVFRREMRQTPTVYRRQFLMHD